MPPTLPELEPVPDGPYPAPGDHVRLRPHALAGQPEDREYLVADQSAGALELNLFSDHPDHPDWAAAVPPADVARITRVNADGPRTWTPPTT